MSRRYPPALRRRALDLLSEGQSVKEVAVALEIGRQTVYRWRRTYFPHPADRRTRSRAMEIGAARARIAELENQLVIHRRFTELLSDVVPPKDGSRSSR
ncbi:helix-turn-helix domain-containing protein [Streptomyces sp. H51]|uniref:helix-turn-helix domain-containing protein n=1 Tax=Streptomyces sp. H51 TaxID=3111770 RepID=UPI002D79C8B4|nr:helix-turn-helix domain-containing protein [Streptomyces sp. H51]